MRDRTFIPDGVNPKNTKASIIFPEGKILRLFSELKILADAELQPRSPAVQVGVQRTPDLLPLPRGQREKGEAFALGAFCRTGE